jgi:hypothetical protein
MGDYVAEPPLNSAPGSDADRSNDTLADKCRWGLWWTCVFTANLPLLFVLGWEHTANRGGTVGMLLAVAGCYATGFFLCVCEGELRLALTRGGLWVALLQLIPVLHLGFGVVAVLIVGEFPLYPFNSTHRELRGFLLTVLTALPLLLAAFLTGGGLRLFRGPLNTDQTEDYG